MLWRRATLGDAGRLAELTRATGRTQLTTAEASGFLAGWAVEIGIDNHVVTAAAAALPPTSESSVRAYGIWWDRRPDAARHANALAQRTVELARTTPAATLQFSLPVTDFDRIAAVKTCGFTAAFPRWTMRHDHQTWPTAGPNVPPDVQIVPWTDRLTDSFLEAYQDSYRDQRVVEPHSAKTWRSILGGEGFSSTISAPAITRDILVVGFVLAFQEGSHVELGPIGTIRSQCGRAISTALLGHALRSCQMGQTETIGLTVDGESPTGAQWLYLAHGFSVTEALMAYSRDL